MNAEELKRYDAYPILIRAVKELTTALYDYGGPETMINRWSMVLAALELKKNSRTSTTTKKRDDIPRQ